MGTNQILLSYNLFALLQLIVLISVILQVVILLLMSGYVFCLLLAKHCMMLKVSFIYLIVLIDLCPKKNKSTRFRSC